MFDKRMQIEVQAAFEYYRGSGFPYEELAPHELWASFFELEDTDLKISQPQQLDLFQQGNCRQLEIRHEGISIANHFHRHIWDSHALGMSSAIEAFRDDKKLYHAIELAKQTAGKITNTAVRNKLKIVHGTQICSNFRPLVAKAIYKEFMPDNGMTLDPSMGYGGRLLGFMASGLQGQYIGVDPAAKTCECNRQMAAFFGHSENIHVICSPIEDIPSDQLPSGIDLVFTSPPYFKKEIYSDEPTQSCNRYETYSAWLDGFWVVAIQRSHKVLKSGGHFVVNVQDVTIRSREYPLLEDTHRLALNAGFGFVEELQMVFAGYGKGLDKFKQEPVLVFEKA